MALALLTRDPDLRAEVGRLAAACGVEPSHADVAEALGVWTTAQVVLVGADVADEVATLGPPRRPGVHLVARGPGDAVFRAAVAVGAESVVDVVAGAARLRDLLSDLGEPALAGRVIGVVGGSGGVGATTLACALAQGGADLGPVLLVDADPVGPGLDRLFGLEEEPGVRWADLQATTGRLAARALRDSVPRKGSLGVLGWTGVRRPLDPSTVREALTAGVRGHGLVVVDLPRHVDALTVEVARRCDELLVVCRRSVAGVAAAARVIEALGVAPGAAGLALRPGGLPVDVVSRLTGLRVVLEVPDQRRVSEAMDLGLGPLVSSRGPLSRAVDEVLGEAA